MKTKIILLSKTITLMFIMLIVLQAGAQRRFTPLTPSGGSDFSYTIANDVQVSDKVMEFDLYLLDTDASQSFELASIQAGILVNSAIYNGGTVTASIVAGSSGLLAAQVPSSIAFASNCIKLGPRTPPQSGNGTIISTSAPGTRICRLRLTNTVAFTPGASAGLTFSFTTSPYATKVSEYISATNTPITCSSANCTSNAVNIFLNAWQGGAGSDWATATNWNPNAAPGATLNAFIPAGATNMPMVNEAPETPATCGTLTISSGATLTIAAGKALTVTGTLTNNAGTAGLVVESGGSLIESTPGVAATLKRVIQGWTTAVKGWHHLSSPVTAQPFQPSFVSNPPSSNEDFYLWDEPTGYWINSKLGSDPLNYTFNPAFGTNFSVGQGYLVSYSATQTKIFTGFLNAGDQVKSCTNTPSNPASGGWNLLGNPFPCAIAWNDGHWGLANVDANALCWNDLGSSYVVTTPSGIIPAMQGFMVYVSPGQSASVTIPALARTHNGEAWLKASGAPLIKLVAHNPAAQTFQESVVTFDPMATTGYDPAFDSYFLQGYAPLFCSVAGSDQLAYNTLPALEGQGAIPFHFVKTEGAEYTIEAAQLDHVPPAVYLTDLKANHTQNLVTDPVYSFTAADGDDPARFLLSFGTVGIGGKTVNPVSVYSSGNNLFVANPGRATLELYSLNGQKLLTEAIDQTGLYKKTLFVPAAWYFVRLTTVTGVVVTKVFIHA